MNVYLWSTELDDVALQSTWLDAIHLGTDVVWTSLPSTKRLYFDVEYSDWTAAICWDWHIDNTQQQPVWYIDLPMDARWVQYTSFSGAYYFSIISSRWDTIAMAIAEDLSSQMPWASFSHFEYRSENWAQKVIIDSVTENYEPEHTLWRIIYHNDSLVMVFNQIEYSLISYSEWDALKNRLNSALQGKWYQGVNSPSSYNYIIYGLDWYIYWLCITMPSGWWNAIWVWFQANKVWTIIYNIVDLSDVLSWWDKAGSIDNIFASWYESAVSQLWLSWVTTIEELWAFIKNRIISGV